ESRRGAGHLSTPADRWLRLRRRDSVPGAPTWLCGPSGPLALGAQGKQPRGTAPRHAADALRRLARAPQCLARYLQLRAGGGFSDLVEALARSDVDVFAGERFEQQVAQRYVILEQQRAPVWHRISRLFWHAACLVSSTYRRKEPDARRPRTSWRTTHAMSVEQPTRSRLPSQRVRNAREFLFGNRANGLMQSVRDIICEPTRTQIV